MLFSCIFGISCSLIGSKMNVLYEQIECHYIKTYIKYLMTNSVITPTIHVILFHNFSTICI